MGIKKKERKNNNERNSERLFVEHKTVEKNAERCTELFNQHAWKARARGEGSTREREGRACSNAVVFSTFYLLFWDVKIAIGQN